MFKKSTIWTEKNIPKLTFIFPIFSILVLASFITYLFNANQFATLEKEAKEIENNYISEQKLLLERRVDSIIAEIRQNVISIADDYKESIKDRVDQAYEVYSYLYKEGFRDKKIFHDALFPIRWNNQRGYYFTLDLHGTILTHSFNPELEGKNVIDMQDKIGNYLFKDFINIAVNRSEGYSKYYWQRPDNKSKVVEKESYVRLFEPLGIIIGTGEYSEVIDDYTKDVVIARLKKLNLVNEEDYVFVFTKSGEVVLHPYMERGENIINLKDKDGKFFIKELIESAKTKDYVEYFWHDFEVSKDLKKIGFTREIGYWDWVIGSGIYMDSINDKIEQKRTLMSENINRETDSMIVISIIITLVVIIISGFLSRTINIIFTDFTNREKEAQDGLKELNKSLESRVENEIQSRMEKEKKILKQTTDTLTSLPNREKLLQDIDDSIYPKLAILNIDRFKEINEYYGHNIGDSVIIKTSEIIKHQLDFTKHKLYRLVGDEFAILTDERTTLQDFLKLLREILKSFDKNSFIIDDNEFNIDITSGISTEKQDIYIHAEMAMKNGKSKNKNINFYDGSEDIQKQYEDNLTWTKKLKNAIKEDRIVVFIQGIIDNSDDSKLKYECLVRLKDRDGNYKSPALFLDIAKKARQYELLTRIIIEKSFKYFEDKDIEFSINLTIDDFLNRETMKFLRDKLENFEYPHNVILEIVESEGIENFEEIIVLINDFKDLGVKIAIDDFGTGYSNFEYLMKLNADYIKIDGSLIKDLDTNYHSQIVVNLIVQFARQLKMKTVAEFVHSKSILDTVKSMGINYSQGFYLSEPAPIDS